MAVNTTTFALIRAQVYTVLEALTPTAKPVDKLFRRAPKKSQTLREWAAESPNSEKLRFFDYRVTGTEEPLPFFDTAAREVLVEATLTVAYPRQVGLYSTDDLDGIEDVMESDAVQIFDAVFTPDNYLSGQNLAEVLRVVPDRPEGSKVWFQEFVVRNSFYRAMSL